MECTTGARRTSCLIAAMAIVAGLLSFAPRSWAASPATDTATAPLTRVAGWTAGPVAAGTGYHRRDGSRRVREVQRRLTRLGFAPGPVDGRFGPRTNHATRRFQAAVGLRADAIVGPATLRALRAESPRRRAAARWTAGPITLGTGYASPQGSRRVREVQWDLRRLGFATGPVDGRFGPLTAAAVRAFRAEHGLRRRSTVAGSTLRALRALVPPAGGARVPSVNAGRPSRAAAPSPRTARRPAEPVTATPDVPPPPPIALIIAALIALGLTTTVLAYVRTRRRVRTLWRALAAQQGGSPAHPLGAARHPAGEEVPR